MGIEEVNKIKSIFKELVISPTYSEHEEVKTSEEAARVRGGELKQGVKALVFTNESDFVIVDVPADKKVDQKAVCDFLGWSKKKIRMANPDEVLKQTGCIIGGVPPFGHKNNLKILVDNGIFDNEFNEFNIGLRTNSVKIRTEDLKTVFEKINAINGSFAKD